LPPTVLASTPKGGVCYVPHDLADARAKDNFANAARLICAAYAVTAVVMALESWVTTAKRGLRTYNVEAGLPALDEARRLVIEEIKRAKREGV